MVTDSLVQIWLDELRKSSGELFDKTMKCILNLSVPRRVLMEKYCKIPPMEETELKKTMEFINEIRPDSETKEDDCKLVYVIGYML